MSRNRFLITAILSVSTLSAQTAPAHFDGKTWWDYVKVLASDEKQGRETGSPGLAEAEAFVVDQLRGAGLQPAGTNGFYQPVEFVSRQIVESKCSLALVRDGKTEPLTLGEDAFFGTRADLAAQVEAPMVFVGWGLKVPEMNYDDLAGLDLKGKVAVILSGAPSEIPGPLAAHYRSSTEHWKALHAAGVIGVVNIPNPAGEDIPWSRLTLNRTHVSMSLADPKFETTQGEQLSVIVNPAHAAQLFTGSGHTFEEIVALAKEHKQLPRFPLSVSIKAQTELKKEKVQSANIVAKLPGSDSALSKEYVVLSAHIDHVGVGQPINGDRIYNGAMDNASGSALLLDVAASLKKSGDKLKRSLLFVFVTGEEKGLLGSRYFAAYPTVDAKSIVADINVDMFLPIIPLHLLTVQGIAESDLGDVARQVADAHGVKVQADPQPQRNSFVRSDQYNFIRHGIPALAMSIAPDPNSEEQKQLVKNWITNRYHAPSDDLDQPIDLGAAAQYEEIIRRLMIEVSDNPQRPQWKPDSFFRRYAENPSQY